MSRTSFPIDPDASDLQDRAEHLTKVLAGLSIYLHAVLDDTAQNVSGGLDLAPIEKVLSDLASDVAGTIQRAADDMAGRLS